MASLDFPGIRDLIEADMQATSFFWRAAGRNIETVILRPVHIMGSVRNAPSNYLRLPRIPVLMGFDPMVQAIHEDDMADAIVLSLEDGVRGVLNVAGSGEYPLSVLVRETGSPTLPIPHPMARYLLTKLWQFHLTSFPVPELAHIQYSCMVDGTRARRLMSFRPKYSLKEIIQAVLAAA